MRPRAFKELLLVKGLLLGSASLHRLGMWAVLGVGTVDQPSCLITIPSGRLTAMFKKQQRSVYNNSKLDSFSELYGIHEHVTTEPSPHVSTKSV